ARMEERISRVLFVNEKIPYDNIGIAQIIEPIRTTLQQATGLGIIARNDDGSGQFTVRAPRREDVDPNDRANRILPDVYWDANRRMMEERTGRVMFVNEKIPYDNIGLAQTIEPTRTTLKQATG